ncbi:MAG: hypothetical protein REI64_09110 [Pedobacter sp.]|uniref:hypothetical protein n=1 Tax=Pedobacter sp. TaxID=1411316 RepID=UPI0028078659|nr:hypothetical protein [Pedobacter sp.]MDQ8004944.1 hypothetical protein [Pedobacter sp.]
MKTLIIFLSFLFLSNSNTIHQDKILKIDKKGNIVGLPKQFTPAKFDLATKKLRIKDREVIFPKCLSSYFEQHRNPKVNLSASWYHEKRILPYYLNFEINDKNSNYGYTILINLETLELIYINKSIIEGNTIHNPKIDLGERCLKDYKVAIKTVD